MTEFFYLQKFLPSFAQNDVLEKQETLRLNSIQLTSSNYTCTTGSADFVSCNIYTILVCRKLLGGQSIKFGNPVKQFHSKLKGNYVCAKMFGCTRDSEYITEDCVTNTTSVSNLKLLSFTEGLFSPDIAKYTELCKKARKKEYHYQQQVYYSNLLQEIVVNRQVCYAENKTCRLNTDPSEIAGTQSFLSCLFR